MQSKLRSCFATCQHAVKQETKTQNALKHNEETFQLHMSLERHFTSFFIDVRRRTAKKCQINSSVLYCQIIIIIIIIINKGQCLWCCNHNTRHYESSPSSSDECRPAETAADSQTRPTDQSAAQVGFVSDDERARCNTSALLHHR